MATVSTQDKIKLVSVRTTNFEKAQEQASDVEVAKLSNEVLEECIGKSQGHFVENIVEKSERAELTTAKYVVSGGRALKSAENFKLCYDLAEALGSQ